MIDDHNGDQSEDGVVGSFGLGEGIDWIGWIDSIACDGLYPLDGLVGLGGLDELDVLDGLIGVDGLDELEGGLAERKRALSIPQASSTSTKLDGEFPEF